MQGFPPEWRFAGPLASRFRQVGNAVPSVFGRVLGQALIAALEGGPRARPDSAPLPRDFEVAVGYTRREQARNGESRRTARERLGQPGVDLHALKGLGSAGPAADADGVGGGGRC